MQLEPGGKKRGWGPVGVGLGSLAALIAVAFAFGIPAGPDGCGGLPEGQVGAVQGAAQQTGSTTAALRAADCGELTVTTTGTCVDQDGTGVRTCTTEAAAPPPQCPAGCEPGPSSFSWKDEFGEDVRGKPNKDFQGMCENRKPPGLDCTFVEVIPCFKTR